ncbi:class I SAM-dependent methyltransferase [Agilicoccus flavus]|uniref:class I SAM-dependent methyltransferase n=1 Tax=Agilicoccus flavus TaxID=2775968 RepID=UPI00355807F7
MTRPVGTVTRGTTNPNRLRKVDRWLAGPQAFRLRGGARPPVVVDLGYGASPVTAVELHRRLRRVAGDVEVVGLEIDPERVRVARPHEREGLRFAVGGFEVPLPGGAHARVVRAFNVLRQYDEAEVAGAWERLAARLDPEGIAVDGTCDELGRRATWVCLDRRGPVTLTLAMSLRHLETPSDLAERLPKALIHHNVPGEAIHAFLADLDGAWARAAPAASFGRRQRFLSAVADATARWPIAREPRRWRQGELTVAWSAVAP